MAAEYLSRPTSTFEMTDTCNGSCLCGAITFTITGVPSTTVLCHCTSCKKSSGSSFMANGFYDKSQFKITSSATTLKTYKDTSPDAGGVVERSFCGSCGSNIFITNPEFGHALIVASGTLDYEEVLTGWAPQAEFYCKRKAPWLIGVGADHRKRFNSMT